MTTASLSETDTLVRDAVMRQLEWDTEVDASEVGVAARDGAVTLTGYINSYPGKIAAERAAKRVRGVRAVANDVQVRLKLPRVDADLAADVVHALRLRSTLPETVQAVVHNGYVTLTGNVNRVMQQRDAEKAVRHVRGIRGLYNHIVVEPGAIRKDVRHRIVAALHRNANLDAQQISVDTEGDEVILSGSVSTWLQRESAERAAADAPGVAHVENLIVVESRLGDLDEEC